ncbi:MAG: tRNA (adenosine(37)-N6)-threonylcarbamoyltransferase complex ATPase subunit type 1 TsaE [Candidatus Omnitrophica bacterium]|nr:tRNA (adenosine(37)-N6)-threonylcarbamoyltransferase complex ATPase subunit type 1 TsaE [Candidatus Omnitrophota bacterium]
MTILNNKKILRSRSSAQTRRIGAGIGARLRPGDVVALRGELGSGKTTLVKGIAGALGVNEREVSSPTFALVHEYRGKSKIYHIDWYRLGRVSGADASLAEECFGSDAITLVEWAERGRALLPPNRIEIHLKHAGGNRRIITLYPWSPKHEKLFRDIT